MHSLFQHVHAVVTGVKVRRSLFALAMTGLCAGNGGCSTAYRDLSDPHMNPYIRQNQNVLRGYGGYGGGNNYYYYNFTPHYRR